MMVIDENIGRNLDNSPRELGIGHSAQHQKVSYQNPPRTRDRPPWEGEV